MTTQPLKHSSGDRYFCTNTFMSIYYGPRLHYIVSLYKVLDWCKSKNKNKKIPQSKETRAEHCCVLCALATCTWGRKPVLRGLCSPQSSDGKGGMQRPLRTEKMINGQIVYDGFVLFGLLRQGLTMKTQLTWNSWDPSARIKGMYHNPAMMFLPQCALRVCK